MKCIIMTKEQHNKQNCNWPIFQILAQPNRTTFLFSSSVLPYPFLSSFPTSTLSFSNVCSFLLPFLLPFIHSSTFISYYRYVFIYFYPLSAGLFLSTFPFFLPSLLRSFLHSLSNFISSHQYLFLYLYLVLAGLYLSTFIFLFASLLLSFLCSPAFIAYYLYSFKTEIEMGRWC